MDDSTYFLLPHDQGHCPCCGNLMIGYGNYTLEGIKQKYDRAEKVRLELQSRGVPVISKEESDRQVAHETRVRFGRAVTVREITEEQNINEKRRRKLAIKSALQEDIELRSKWIADIENELSK